MESIKLFLNLTLTTAHLTYDKNLKQNNQAVDSTEKNISGYYLWLHDHIICISIFHCVCIIPSTDHKIC